MGGLREHVEGVHALKVVANLSEVLQVAGERARVAGDVDDLLRLEVDQSLAGVRIQASPGWIKHDQIDGFDLLHEFRKNEFDSAFVKADVLKLVQVAREIEAG